MGQYKKAILTTVGEKLIAQALSGEIQLTITKAKTSNYVYPSDTDYKSLTDLQGVKQIVSDPVTTVQNDTMIQTRALFSNEEITSTYYIQNIGLYTMDGTQEVLFCIVTAETPDEMPQYNGVASTSYIYNIQNVVQDATELNIVVAPSGTATIQEVLERVDATGGDISETVIETLEATEDKYPVPAAGETAKVFMGKVTKFINDINDYIKVREVTLTAIGWEGSSAPYMQTIEAIGVTEDSEAIVLSALEDGATENVQKAYAKAFGIVVSGTASLGAGTATFKVYKKPATDIKIGLKGV